MSSGIPDVRRAESLIARAIADAIRPDPPLSVWKWADEYRMLSSKAASAPGKYRSERTPYLREIMDCLSVESPIRRVVVKKPAQVGFSEALNNWIGYVIHHAPGPMLLVQPTVDLCKRYSKQRIAPMINDCRRGPTGSRDPLAIKPCQPGKPSQTAASPRARTEWSIT